MSSVKKKSEEIQSMFMEVAALSLEIAKVTAQIMGSEDKDDLLEKVIDLSHEASSQIVAVQKAQLAKLKEVRDFVTNKDKPEDSSLN